MSNSNIEPNKTIALAGGCFWCLEAVYQKVNGVISSISGYTGGDTTSPTYEQVCGGKTNHAEAIELTYDPAIISLESLLEIFFEIHDPTTLNQQGGDTGTQYRSSIFYTSPEDLIVIEATIAKKQAALNNASSGTDKQIVTEVKPLDIFYKAEDYHQDYYNSHPDQPYCAVIISPKLHKFLKKFPDMVKN